MLASNRDAGVSRLAFHIFRDSVVLMVVVIAASAIAAPSEAFLGALWPDPANEVPEDFSAVINAQQPFDYAPYLSDVNEPLLESELENILDFNDRDLDKEFDFDPTHILTLLIDTAAAQHTSPETFFEEIQDLIALQERSKAEPAETYESQNVISSTQPTEAPKSAVVGLEADSSENSRFLEENPWHLNYKEPSNELDEQPTEILETTSTSPEISATLSTFLTTKGTISSGENLQVQLSHLEMKYNISSKCQGHDSITPFRLTLMFPHYQNLGQKPFVNTSYIEIHRNDGVITTTTPNYYHNYYPQPIYQNNGGYLSRTVQVPSFFTRHEFGGLIPQFGQLAETARTYIIAIHLYSLYRNEGENKDASVPFRTKCAMVRMRMDRSLVSDDRRIRFLQNNDVLTEDGLLTKEISQLYSDLVPSDFYYKIFWKIFKQ